MSDADSARAHAVADAAGFAIALDRAIGALVHLRASLAAGAGHEQPAGAADTRGATLGVVDVARRLKRHPDTVRDDLRTGRLPGVKIGRSWRVVEADLLAHLQRTTTAKRHDAQRVADARAWLKAERAKRRSG